MDVVVRYTKFSSNPHGDGGSKRSAQIEEYWRSRDVEFIDEKFDLPKQYSKIQAFRWVCRAIGFIGRNVGWGKYRGIRDKFQAILIYALRIPIIYDKYIGQAVTFLWENTQDEAAMYLMRAAGAKIIGYPHNMESLVPTQHDPISHKVAPYWLYEEIERLKLCDEVYAISKEETWLLQLFGVNAKYYPYYPQQEVEQKLLEIKKKRDARKGKGKKQYLVLGSASNPPTRMAMQMLVDYFAKHTERTYEVHIAGYQTECLQIPSDSNLIIHGTISSEQLYGLMIETDGMIVYQPATSGALTRIIECHIAGIPIYANFSAARDYYNLPDVHVYDGMEQLLYMLNKESDRKCSK